MSPSSGGTVPVMSTVSNLSALSPAESQTTCLAGPPMLSRSIMRTTRTGGSAEAEAVSRPFSLLSALLAILGLREVIPSRAADARIRDLPLNVLLLPKCLYEPARAGGRQHKA